MHTVCDVCRVRVIDMQLILVLLCCVLSSLPSPTSLRFLQAIEFYTYATEMDPKNHIYMTNRALCYASMKKWDKSLRDADKAVALKSDWEKVGDM